MLQTYLQLGFSDTHLHRLSIEPSEWFGFDGDSPPGRADVNDKRRIFHEDL
jgi:hypothetical protein